MAGPGRPKGVPNKLSAQVKENVVHVFEQMGGVKKMAAWAELNQTEFYKLYARLLPTEATLNVRNIDAADLSDADLANIASGSSEGIAGEADSAEVPTSVH